MQGYKIHLLVTVDQNYMKPLQTMLKSFVVNNIGETIHVWLLHSGILKKIMSIMPKPLTAATGMAFSDVGLGIAHTLAHTLGAVYDIHHGVVCAMILPIVI